MLEEIIKIRGKKESFFLDKVKGLLPEGGNLNLCLTCGACSSGCPATGLENMDPRKFLRMAALGMDEQVTTTPWVWMCTMCQRCLRNDSCSAMGTSEEDFQFVVEDVLEEYQEAQPEFKDMKAPIDKQGAEFFLNQNSREPVTEPDELVPLWKILHLAGVDWTYGSKGWAAENYCMFLADDKSWEHITRITTKQADDLGCKIFLNTE